MQSGTYVTDGGLETDLIFHHGIDLPYFAAFPLVNDIKGRETLERYYDGYAAIAAEAGRGLMLETPTWRANPDWASKVGYSPQALAKANAESVNLLAGLKDRYGISDCVISGAIGPRGDGYRADHRLSPDEAASYHSAQIEALAGADRVTAYTLTHTGEAIGIVRAARNLGMPVAISFTVETDGRLPDGTALAQAITETDEAAAPDYYLVNCAHPVHIGHAFGEPGAWSERIHGLRVNASQRSHAELDEAEELDEGDPAQLALDHRTLEALLPNLSIIGGCCGTDARHVAAFWNTSY